MPPLDQKTINLYCKENKRTMPQIAIEIRTNVLHKSEIREKIFYHLNLYCINRLDKFINYVFNVLKITENEKFTTVLKKIEKLSSEKDDTFFLTVDNYFFSSPLKNKKTKVKNIDQTFLRIHLIYFRLTQYVEQHNKNWKIYISISSPKIITENVDGTKSIIDYHNSVNTDRWLRKDAKLIVYFGNNSTAYVSIIIPTDCLSCYAETLLMLKNNRPNINHLRNYTCDGISYGNFEELIDQLTLLERLVLPSVKV